MRPLLDCWATVNQMNYSTELRSFIKIGILYTCHGCLHPSHCQKANQNIEGMKTLCYFERLQPVNLGLHLPNEDEQGEINCCGRYKKREPGHWTSVQSSSSLGLQWQIIDFIMTKCNYLFLIIFLFPVQLYWLACAMFVAFNRRSVTTQVETSACYDSSVNRWISD